MSNKCSKVPDKQVSPHFGNPPQRRTKGLPDLIREAAEKAKSKTANPPQSTATPMDLDDAGDMTDADPNDAASRIALNASLTALDAKLAQLKATPDPDPDILKAIEERQTKREQLLADIRNTKPLNVQLSNSLRAADKCRRKLSKALDEENDFRVLLDAKNAEVTMLNSDFALHEQLSTALQAQLSQQGPEQGQQAQGSTPCSDAKFYQIDEAQMHHYQALLALERGKTGTAATDSPVTATPPATPESPYATRGFGTPPPPYFGTPPAFPTMPPPAGPGPGRQHAGETTGDGLRPFRTKPDHKARADPYLTPSKTEVKASDDEVLHAALPADDGAPP